MFGTLKTVEDYNLYASFGLVDGLSDDELMDINGGDCGINITVGCLNITWGGGKSKSNSDSGNSGGSSGSSSSSSSS